MSKYSKCLIRQRLVKETPEEIVRQSLLKKMLALGFPRGLISVEKQINERRYDIVSFTKEMQPLIVIECKAGALDAAAKDQVFGYRSLIQAPFVALANGHQVHTFWHGSKGIQSVPFLPRFSELYEISRRL